MNQTTEAVLFVVMIVVVICSSIYIGYAFRNDDMIYEEVGYIDIIKSNGKYFYEYNYTKYMWTKNNSYIDNKFIELCYEFSEDRIYNLTDYNCVDYSIDFTNLMVSKGYKVSSIAVYNTTDENYKSRRGHRLNYFVHNDGSISYIEPQHCNFYPSWDEVTLHYYNYTK